jgi:hypothetical protein
MAEKFKLSPGQIGPLAQGRGSCIASDRITVSGRRVGYMYREEPDHAVDSGWRFFSGDESEDVLDDPSCFEILDVNTVANYDPDIIPLLDQPVGSAWARNANGAFEAEAFPAAPS